jgi:ankyrin repeat protein
VNILGNLPSHRYESLNSNKNKNKRTISTTNMTAVLEPDYQDLPDAEFDLAEDELDDDIDHNFHFQHPDTTWENRLKEAGETIRNQKKFTTQGQVADFLHRFGDVTRQCNVQAGTILHVLVEVVQHNRLIPEDVELLARALVEQAPDLVAVSNKDKKTPILMAIRFCQDRLLEYMITSCVEHEDQPNAIKCLNDALSRPHDGTETALHAAFGEKLNWKSLKLLMEHATNETLSIGDNMQKTPMHHAVQFKSGSVLCDPLPFPGSGSIALQLDNL